jgi:acetyl esterase/lipase
VAGKLVDALNSHDVEGGVALFADDATVDYLGQTSYSGKADIRLGLEDLASDSLAMHVKSTSSDEGTVSDSVVISTDSWRAMEIPNLDGTATVNVKSGRVQSLQISLSKASADELQVTVWRTAKPTYPNIAYNNDANPDHLLDLYLPSEGQPPYPTILMLHGDGDQKEDHNGMAAYFNEAGFAAVLPDYSDDHFQMVADALCSLAWTGANAGKYGLDADRIAVFGFSVGGMVAATMGALDDPAAELQGCNNSLPAGGSLLGVAVYEGVLGTPEGCFSHSWCLAGATSGTGIPLMQLQPIFDTLRDTPPQDWKDPQIVGPEAQAFASKFPLFWLDGSEPPYLIIHGAGDLIPRTGSEAFARRLEDAGVSAQLVLLPDASHQSVYPASPSFPKIAGAVVDFAERLGGR